MYPECRHVLASGNPCNSPALAESHWCFFHSRLHRRQSERAAHSPARHNHRQADGRFAALPASQDSNTDTIDYGSYPVSDRRAPSDPRVPHPDPEQREGEGWDTTALDLPPIEDTASIQLALIDILQALAANRIDGKRAGLLLYGLQVASANVKNMRLSSGAVRAITHTDDGTPLAPQDYGYDAEDYEDEDDA